jgi:hypothetical protein
MSLNKRRFLLVSAIAGMLLLFFSSCSQKKNTFTSRNYHSLTAHYNGLYWANVSIQEGVDNLEKAHKDDYTKLLPLFKYADEEAAKANYPPFDKAIEKTNKVIQYHSMMIKGKEYNRWIDENYMALGKSHFYKRDYFAAVTVFEYVVKVFAGNPVKYDAFLWLVRCYNQMNSVIKTGPILDLLKHDKKLPKRLLDDYYSVLAEYNIKTEEYTKAEDALAKAISLTKKRRVRGRYYYLLAQLQEQDGKLKKASDSYHRCAKLHPSYEMEFNARLSKARTFQVDKGDGTQELISELNKMLKDEKNKEYKDQVYYAIADITYRQNKEKEAVELFKKSAQSSLANTKQKAMSFLRVAEIYFAKREYKPAQVYYDSTIMLLPQDFKNYEQIKNKKETLSTLINKTNTIARQDSLLKIAGMDTTRINKIIDKIIADLIKEEEQKKKEEEQKNQLATTPYTTPQNAAPLVASAIGSWYFYNQSTIALGLAEFFKKWGNRPLEDNWRRTNKEIILATTETASTQLKKDSTGTNKLSDKKTRAYYKKNIPFTHEQQTASHTLIINSYYDLGALYKEDLQDPAEAALTFEKLLQLYPTSNYTLNLYYQLYRIYLTEKKAEKANDYKAKILNEYADSEYAKIINNPDYQKALNASQNEIETYYNQTYTAFRQSQHEQVIAMVNKADSFYASSGLMPKFALLRAYSIGKTKTLTEYEYSLQGIVAKYPKDPAKEKAQEILEVLKKKNIPAAHSTNNRAKAHYTFSDSAKHVCMILYSALKLSAEDITTRLTHFNTEYFSTNNLSMSTTVGDTAFQIIIIRSFESASDAKNYYTLLTQNGNVFTEVSPNNYSILPISVANQLLFMNFKNVNEYKAFFTENYLKEN